MYTWIHPLVSLTYNDSRAFPTNHEQFYQTTNFIYHYIITIMRALKHKFTHYKDEWDICIDENYNFAPVLITSV